MFFLEPSLLVGRLLVPAAFAGFGLEDIVSSPTMPQRAFTLPNVCLYRTAEILCAWKCGGGGGKGEAASRVRGIPREIDKRRPR